jgi:hypothetical protein
MRFHWITLAWTFASIAAGCGGSETAIVGDAAAPDSTTTDGHANPDVSADTSKDSPSDSPASDTATDAPSESGNDSGACTGTSKPDCVTCCTNAHPEGRVKLETFELDCACGMASLCGPLDAGSVDGGTPDGSADGGTDAGVLGHGACDPSCSSATTAPSAACVTCLRGATGTMKAPGSCYDSVMNVCARGTSCYSYVECVATCDGTP